jgi:DNA-binding FadR family transcriptional regulator
MAVTSGARDGVELTVLPGLRRQNLAARVALILKRYILVERLPVGHRLPSERRLAAWLNVSRTVLREALGELIGEGILHRASPHALCVTDFDRSRLAAEVSLVGDEVADTQDLIELRVIIELGAIEAIVERVNVEHLIELERWVVEGEQRLAVREPIYRADARFHAALLRVLGNRVVDGLLPLIEENLRQDLVGDPHQLTGVGTPDDYRVVRQHREIYEAVKRRDPIATRQWMLAHLTPYLQRPRRVVEELAGSVGDRVAMGGQAHGRSSIAASSTADESRSRDDDPDP